MEKRNIVLIIILIILITIVMFSNIIEEVTITEEYSQNEQFIFIDESHIGDIVIYRCYDKDTKVIYMFTGSNYSKLTVMVDADGKPLLYEEENNNEW